MLSKNKNRPADKVRNREISPDTKTSGGIKRRKEADRHHVDMKLGYL